MFVYKPCEVSCFFFLPAPNCVLIKAKTRTGSADVKKKTLFSVDLVIQSEYIFFFDGIIKLFFLA